MASVGTTTVDAKDIASSLTVNVIIRRGYEWRWRLWVSTQLIRLACWIAWTDYEIVDEEKTDVG